MSVLYRSLYMACLIGAFASGGCLCAAETEGARSEIVEVKATVNKKAVKQNEIFTYTIFIKGSFKATPKITIPEFKDFTVIGRSQSQGISHRENTREAYFVFEYALRPKKSGELTIPPVQVAYQSKTYQSEEVSITVAESNPLDKLKQQNNSERISL